MSIKPAGPPAARFDLDRGAEENAAMFPNPGGLIYGTLVVGALLSAESTRHETFAATIGAVVLALALYSLTHAYSDLAEERLERNVPLTLAGLGRTLLHELTIDAGAVVPLLALLIAWAVGADLKTAVAIAIWASAAVIVVIEVVAGIRAELTGRQLAVQITAGVLFGLGVIGLQVILH